MDRKIQVSAVSYLNTKPLIFGFEQGMMKDMMAINFNYPSKVAESLMKNEVDIGLIPVAVMPSVPEHYIVSDYGIATDGEVASVCLFSDVPLKQIETIYLDYQSRTSVALLKILLQEHWKINPQLLPASVHYENNIKGSTAGLVIGDRALIQRKHSKFIFDLGTGWKEMTGLPFVFAAWVANKTIPENFQKAFNTATAKGISHIDEIVQSNHFPEYDLRQYYTQNISYMLDDRKLLGLQLFLKLLPK